MSKLVPYRRPPPPRKPPAAAPPWKPPPGVTVLKARQVVFDRTLAYPWLLLDLPEGRYQIEATFAGRIQRWAVVSHRADAIPHDLYLDVLA